MSSHSKNGESVPKARLNAVRVAALARLHELGGARERLLRQMAHAIVRAVRPDEQRRRRRVRHRARLRLAEEVVRHGVAQDALEAGPVEVESGGELGEADAAGQGDGARDVEVADVTEAGAVVELEQRGRAVSA